MPTQSQNLGFDINPLHQHFCQITITIPSTYVSTIYEEAASAQQKNALTYGFSKGAAPLAYIKEHYRTVLIEHVKEFLFKYFIINFLYHSLYEHAIQCAGDPRLISSHIEPETDATFLFEVSLAEPIDFKEWKHFSFKAPRRKNYKDIDRQVDLFIKEEEELRACSHQTVCVGDWVCFSIALLNNDQKPLLDTYQEIVWLKIGNEEADIPFQELFLNKKIDDYFVTNHSCLQEYFSNLDTHYIFGITILDMVSQHFFCLDHFKHHFRLKTNKDLHQKLIEVFSYRNDLSQRRSTVEEALKLLISKHPVDVPHHYILRQQKLVLESVQNNPDYQVYKTQNNFRESLKQLAAKEAKELIFIDQLSHHEDIAVNDHDIRSYLNLLKRARTKEFVYFHTPPTKIQGQEIPLPIELLKQSCRREKTLNHVIYHLTRK